MSGAEVTISCPHCHRTYTMKIEPERLKRLKTRATCGRCGNTFDAASRIVPASEATTAPKLPRIDVNATPVSQLIPSAASTPSPVATIPDLNDEMEELAREFAEAAARFTPIAVKRPAAVLPPPVAAPSSTQPDLRPPVIEQQPRATLEQPQRTVEQPQRTVEQPQRTVEQPQHTVEQPQRTVEQPPRTVEQPQRTVEQPQRPTVEQPPPPASEEPPPASAVAPAVAAPADAAPSDSDIADAYDQLSLEAAPAAAEELAATVPTQSRARPAPPRDWLDLADPGLAALQAPPSAGAAALEALLNESERIALPATSS